ncbi:heavy-metal-associated domain-containing protein [Agrococcus sp. ARC_14]|uniref:heavy-metal-associated domain-containing protein n=1 Tax=Agrococcus sp. ARC_14 TaxID=2919927 RepID=UPI001F057C23|nr:heavy-metal-associated domain-containing protein [Agrococcus sp. ARC_14]MCH1884001.1 heavy-metal-associated domain-containing protein [Agrococcus sp. ARC_14]
MNTAARLSLYGLGLVAAFGAAFVISGVVVPDAVVDARATATEDGHGAHQEPAAPEAAPAALPGLSLETDGYQLSPVTAPGAVGEEGELRFTVLDANGDPLREYTEEHEKELHLIVVRADGSEFRHVHPELDSDGAWSLPWAWDEAGSYRVFADFTPATQESGITLTRSISVAGDFAPVAVEDEVRTSSAGEFEVQLSGDLAVGDSSTLTVEVTRDGEPVTEMQPYLGAFGHLVALRDGDLAYLHVHPEGAEPEAGDLSGPTVDFATEAPTAGRYLLYFDFQVDGEVQTASFVLSTEAAGATDTPVSSTPDESPEEAPADDGHDDH